MCQTIKLILDIYKDFGFEDVKIYLSTRPDSIYRIGSDEIWDISEKALANALEHNGYAYEINEGEGAFTVRSWNSFCVTQSAANGSAVPYKWI